MAAICFNNTGGSGLGLGTVVPRSSQFRQNFVFRNTLDVNIKEAIR